MQPDAECAQKDRRQEFALADANVEQVLLVVFEFHPRAAIRNNLRDKELSAFEEHTGRAMKLRNDYALSSVDDEGSVVGHQRNLTKENFFFLDIANRLNVRVGILVVNRETNLDLERHAVTHAALLTLLLIVLVFQSDRLAAIRAQFGAH